MTVKYYSYNGGYFSEAKVPKDLKKELKVKWFINQKALKKVGINSFKEYVQTVYSFNV